MAVENWDACIFLLVVYRRAWLTICRWGGSIVRGGGMVGMYSPTGQMCAVLVRSTLQG